MREATIIQLCTTALVALSLEAGAVSRPTQDLHRDDLSETYLEYVRARGPFRPFELRLSGPWVYAPYDPDRRPGSIRFKELVSPSVQRVIQLEDRIRREAEANPTSGRLGAAAVLSLIRGDTHLAVSQLELASLLDPANENLWNDLGVSRWQEFVESQETDHLVRALSDVERALEQRPIFPEALFNRRKILEKLFLPVTSRQATVEYRCLDPSSEWSGELVGSTTSPADPPTSGEPDLKAAYDRARLELVPNWAEAMSQGRDEEAAEVLGELKKTAEDIRSANGDDFLQLTWEDIVSSVKRGRVDELIVGFRSFKQGCMLRDKQAEYARSRDLLQLAVTKLEAVKNPFRYQARADLSVSDYFLERYGPLTEDLAALEREIGRTSFHSLRGRVCWVLGLGLAITGRAGASLQYYQKGLAEYRRSEEPEQVVSMMRLIADARASSGDYGSAWNQLHYALGQIYKSDDMRRRYAFVYQAATTCQNEGLPHVALDFEHEAVSYSDQLGQAWFACDSRLKRARTLGSLGRPVEALNDIAHAKALISRISDEKKRERMVAETKLANGELVLRTEPAKALQFLAEARDHFKATGHTTESTRITVAIAEALAASGQRGSAIRELRKAIFQTRQYLQTVSDSVLQERQLEKIVPLYDQLILQLMETPEAALAEAENVRRILWARQDGAKDADLEMVSDWVGVCPIQRRVLVYSVLADRLAVWAISPRGVSSAAIPVSRSRLGDLMDRLMLELQSNAYGSAASTELFDLLVRPQLAQIGDARDLVIVPDKELFRIPFGALLDKERGRFLLDDHNVSLALTIGGWEERPAGHGGFFERPLVLGAPAFDRADFSSLETLVWAETEAKNVAAMLPGSELLLGPNATAAALMERAPQSSAIIYAGHSIRQDNTSALVLAPDGRLSAADVLTAGQISKLDLSRVALVVLSACESANVNWGGSSSARGLAQAFLQAGAEEVVATLLPVDDTRHRQLLEAFFRQMLDNPAPAEALRSARLSQKTRDYQGNSSDWVGIELYRFSALNQPVR